MIEEYKFNLAKITSLMKIKLQNIKNYWDYQNIISSYLQNLFKYQLQPTVPRHTILTLPPILATFSVAAPLSLPSGHATSPNGSEAPSPNILVILPHQKQPKQSQILN